MPLTKHPVNNVEGIVYPIVRGRHRQAVRNAWSILRGMPKQSLSEDTISLTFALRELQ